MLCSTNLVEKVKVRKERVFGNMKNIMKTSIKNLPGGIFFHQLMFNSKNQLLGTFQKHIFNCFTLNLLRSRQEIQIQKNI